MSPIGMGGGIKICSKSSKIKKIYYFSYFWKNLEPIPVEHILNIFYATKAQLF